MKLGLPWIPILPLIPRGEREGSPPTSSPVPPTCPLSNVEERKSAPCLSLASPRAVVLPLHQHPLLQPYSTSPVSALLYFLCLTYPRWSFHRNHLPLLSPPAYRDSPALA